MGEWGGWFSSGKPERRPVTVTISNRSLGRAKKIMWNLHGTLSKALEQRYSKVNVTWTSTSAKPDRDSDIWISDLSRGSWKKKTGLVLVVRCHRVYDWVSPIKLLTLSIFPCTVIYSSSWCLYLLVVLVVTKNVDAEGSQGGASPGLC